MPFETSSLTSHPAESVLLEFEYSYYDGGGGYFFTDVLFIVSALWSLRPKFLWITFSGFISESLLSFRLFTLFIRLACTLTYMQTTGVISYSFPLLDHHDHFTST
ncbi:hypothetical protein F4604DRAFT_1765262 [Suillus subluteus]|nr:hypothetical protein F4604DRAFT_1765262 [Suillus subluteus]